MEVRFERHTPEAIQFIADNMRQEDVDEVWAFGRQTPLEALRMSVEKSYKVAVIVIDDEPVAIFGLAIRDFLSGTGVPWLLSAKQALKNKRQFLILSKPLIKEMLKNCPKLVNYVYAGSKLSIRWLCWLGFTIEPAMPIRTTGEMFHRFYMEKV